MTLPTEQIIDADIVDGLLVDIPLVSSNWVAHVFGKTVVIRLDPNDEDAVSYVLRSDPVGGTARGQTTKKEVVRRINQGDGELVKVKVLDRPTPLRSVNAIDIDSGRVVSRLVPVGWKLVFPYEVIDDQCLCAYMADGTLRHCVDTQADAYLGQGSLGKVYRTVVQHKNAARFDTYLWQVIRPEVSKGTVTPMTSTPTKKDEDEHAKMCKFFFGRTPTDPSKLPPPPKVLGTSWDELAEW